MPVRQLPFASLPWKTVGLVALHLVLCSAHVYTAGSVAGVFWFMNVMPGNEEAGLNLAAGWISLFIVAILLHALLILAHRRAPATRPLPVPIVPKA